MTDIAIMLFFGERTFVALLAGLIMGIERTLTGHSAGVKTLVFVCMGSSMFTTLSFYLHTLYPSTDPTRIIGQIITGIGFLGAGVIFQQQQKISGLTSAGIIWTSCALGTIAGSGLFWVPIFASITFVVVMLCLKRLESYLEQFEKDNKNKTE